MSRHGLRFLHVRRIWIFALSGSLWTVAAIVLLRRALFWTLAADATLLYAAIPVLLGCTAAGYLLWFRKIVARNIQRMDALPPLAGIWEVASPQGYGIILVMVTLGALLRSSDVPRLLLAGPYALMGGMLLLGSIRVVRAVTAEVRSTAKP